MPAYRPSDTFAHPTRFLEAEHRVIERVLAAFHELTNRLEQGIEVELADVLDALRFFRVFADLAHHAKEEELLFPALEAAGLPRRAGPTSVMREEHELGRALVTELDLLAVAACDHPGDIRDRFVRCARRFVELLRDHIRKEDGILFPMADQMLDATTTRHLMSAFRRLMEDEEQEREHARQLAVAEQLVARYGGSLPDAGSALGSCGGGCGHLHS